jgi:hypothetical protein
MLETITAILPINRWHNRTDAAVRSVLEQRGVAVELILVINGLDEHALRAGERMSSLCPNIRMLHTPIESLPVALNLGLHASECELVARMDSDDLSHPDRFARQAAYLQEHPDLAGCGCGADFVDATGRSVHVVTPPTSAAQARWKLLLSNVFVHGSMMLRRDAVLEAGGYNESFDRAQDYDLWLRLSRRGLGGIPDICYTYLMPASLETDTLDSTQAARTASLLVDAWAGLPSQEPSELRALMARMLRNDLSARTELESLMEREGPTRELIQAWMWSCRHHPIPQTDSVRRLARAEAARIMLHEMDISEVWLWGAGDLARMLIGSASLATPVAGIADDARAGQACAGFLVCTPEEIPADAAVLIASDLYEDAIWERSTALRAKGVRVLRMPSL